AHELRGHVNVDRADVCRNFLGLADLRQRAEETLVRALIAQQHPQLRERACATGLPEAAAGEGRRSVRVPLAVPRRDEVREPTVVVLHVEEELGKTLGPGAHV